MDLKSGVFTAPVPGIYHFEFSGSKDKSTIMLDIYLQLNGENIGHTCAYEPAMKNEETASLSASLRLKAGDRVRLFIDYNSILFDDQYHPPTLPAGSLRKIYQLTKFIGLIIS